MTDITISSGTTDSNTVVNSGDTIAGGTVSGNSQLIDATGANPDVIAGAMTVSGCAGATTVWAGRGDSITGGTTPIDDNYGSGGSSTITGGTVTGAGGLPVDTEIVGAAGDTIAGGAGAATVQAANDDTVTGGSGTLQIYLDSDQRATTVNLGAGHGAARLRDVSVTGGAGSVISITGFAAANDVIQSKSSVSSVGSFLGTSTADGHGGTILTFLDGTTMTLAGVSDPSKITFAT